MKYIKLFNEHSSYEDFTGTTAFVKPNVSVCKSPKEVHYTPEPYNWARNYLTIQTLSANTTITVYYPSNLQTTDYAYMEYSLDSGNTWEREEKGSDVARSWTVVVPNPQDVLFRGSGNTMCLAIQSGSSARYFPISFSSDLPFNVFGNIHSLLRPETYFTDQIPLYALNFSRLFAGSQVVDASNLILPATTLAIRCYDAMFSGCTSLTSTPELPATTLANSCYYAMFQNCTSLTTAPELPATALTISCYQEMFKGCTNLTTAPELSATTLVQGCYQNMFGGCTSLTTAPELPATTLATNCYYNMFSGCTNLNSITCLATSISALNCTTNWVSGVAASGTFTKPANMSNWTTGINGIPTGWTVVDA